ncbi:Holliday junction resolvase RecU [Furfurilactobacillus siliginis]|uniref:Holliday junction resolvase RecU n=1 Tax=Furfurilactobacillus siliginis TaxID=348151 RepID=A0A0R2LD98_9LACO|nr:Holliday junction resolvase RecU [Furfurilactobacillus siliginis]KRN96954.1 recombination protein U [Furfurilactobacillus siliginis]GEK27713.1 Holliday junction resolvase RecU [Furfurilactobacillus siliginis]
MNIRYPNGAAYHGPNQAANKQPVTTTSYSDRGMSLEAELNESNQYYLANDIAVIHKKPTPIQIVKVDYPKRSAATIREAYFRQPSTTDYNGVYRGHYIDFDAKETKNKTSFPLKNFHEHQIIHLRACVKAGGIGFAIIRFTNESKTFLLPATTLFEYWDAQAHDGRKSIPRDVIEDAGFLIPYHMNPLIPYLNAVDQLIAAQK